MLAAGKPRRMATLSTSIYITEMQNAFVYILECADGSYYVGSHRGNDVNVRVSEHKEGKHRDAYTFTRRPVKLVWSDWVSRFDYAVALERRIKGWSRAKKQALIRGDYDTLQFLAKRPGAKKKLSST